MVVIDRAVSAVAAVIAAWVPALSQEVTNGASILGTLSHAPLAMYVDGPIPTGTSWPWGNRNCNNTNPYDTSTTPNTGMTRYYDWTITNTTLAPDGVSLPLLVVNGQFPGPQIEANWGDWIEVKVTNGLLNEGTSLHWHGFLQTGTPYYDGVPGVSQCPIAPGKSFTYRFRAELYGTTWWHSHWSSQYINGLAGPIVIHGPTSSHYDIDLGPVMLTDWFHNYYRNLVNQIFVSSPFGPILPPHANNMLINGKSNYNCSLTKRECTSNAGMARFRFQSGKRHLLRLINHSAEAVLFFSIDGYRLKVIALDFVPVDPYETDMITLAVGQRFDVVVVGKGSSKDSVWMRLTEGPSGEGPDGGLAPAGTGGCSLNDGHSYSAKAAIYYEDADTSLPPTTANTISTSRLIFPLACQNDPLNTTQPAFKIPLKDPDHQKTFTLTGGYNATGDFHWYMNNITYEANFNNPTLLFAKNGDHTFAPERAVQEWGGYSSVRIIIQAQGLPASHPWHMHGHNMQVLAQGFGVWDGHITHAHNPLRRDVHLMAPLGYIVVQIDLDNPGVWPFHCHIAWHLSEGNNILFVEQQAKFEQEVSVPYVLEQTCTDWNAFTAAHAVDQIDSGI